MAGHFTVVDPDQCEYYARFINHLSRRQADVIFWGNFCLTIILLIIASQMYTKASLNPNHRRIRIQCLIISLLCFGIALPAVALSALAGLQIEFCDGEDLMHFYWSFWTLIQVGSLIAILGVSVNQCYGIGGKRGPPWNVALGTPVLVIAALGHAGDTGGRAIWKRISRRTLRDSEGAGGAAESEVEVDLEAQKETEEHREERLDKTGGLETGLGTSRAPTIINASNDRPLSAVAKLVSYTLDNEPLYTMSPSPSDAGSPSCSPRRSPSTASVKSVLACEESPSREIRFADEEADLEAQVGRKLTSSIYRHQRADSEDGL